MFIKLPTGFTGIRTSSLWLKVCNEWLIWLDSLGLITLRKKKLIGLMSLFKFNKNFLSATYASVDCQVWNNFEATVSWMSLQNHGRSVPSACDGYLFIAKYNTFRQSGVSHTLSTHSYIYYGRFGMAKVAAVLSNKQWTKKHGNRREESRLAANLGKHQQRLLAAVAV